ncbi:MAG: polysaccharide biosynthesis/export family protein, partial [Pseudorhodoplanes sp.]
MAALSLAGCTTRRQVVAYGPAPYAGGPYAAAGTAYAAQGAVFAQPYTLDTGDRLRVSVFGQEGVSNTYLVDAAGYVNLALTGPVAARGHTAASLAQAIAARLREGYIREPHVSV